MNYKSSFTGLSVMALVALCLPACKVPYDPPVKNPNASYLVVEGYINGDGGVSTIKLSRTRNITWGDTAAYVNETNAVVAVQDDQNNVYPLNSGNDGMYAGSFTLSASIRYRLHIVTSDGKEYISLFVPFKQAPPIDNLDWSFKNRGVQVYLNSHDAQSKTRYYRWNYIATYEYRSTHNSNLKYIPDDSTVVPRTEQVDTCWRTNNSGEILLGSSAKLTQDVIDQQPIVYIPFQDVKLNVLYSIIVTQSALDSSAYNYWQAIKSNTENVGSVFDRQPNQTRGNVYCVTDSAEIVLGYIGAGNSTQSRIFISNSQMPSNWIQAPSDSCDPIEVPFDKKLMEKFFHFGGWIPYEKDTTLTGRVKGYFSSFGSCVDCTLKGGSNKKPVFWPY